MPRRGVLLALLGVVGAALLLLTVATAPAAAHAELIATTPADGAVLDRAPATVTVQLSEAVETTPDGLRVLDSKGTRVDAGDATALPDRPGTIAVNLRPGLADGTYTVSWHATSADSHPVHGAFTFTVGQAEPAATPPESAADADRDLDPVLGALVTLARGAGYIGLALLVGAVGILLLAADGTDRTGPYRLAVGGAALIVCAACASLLAQGPYTAGAGPGALLDLRSLRPTLTSRLGIALQSRIALAALVVALLAMARRRPAVPSRTVPRSLLVFVPITALAATYSAAGHAATGRWTPLALIADVLHLLAMGLWLGGLVTLIALCIRRTAAGPLAATIARFSPLAAWCVAVLVVTGAFQAQRQMGIPADPLATEYGRLLAAKVLAVLAVLAVAYRARRWTRAHTRPATGQLPAPKALRTLRRTLVLEAAGGAVIIALSTLLAGSVPPHSSPAAAPAEALAPVRMEAAYDSGGEDGRGTVTARIVRRTGGGVDLDLRLTDSSGKPVTPEEITASWSLPALRLGPLPATLKSDGPGHWTSSVTLSPGGRWRLAVTVRTSDVDLATVTFQDIEAGGASSSPR